MADSAEPPLPPPEAASPPGLPLPDEDAEALLPVVVAEELLIRDIVPPAAALELAGALVLAQFADEGRDEIPAGLQIERA